MGYNIDHTEYLSGGPLKIKRSVAREFQEEFGWDDGSGELPEDNFLDDLDLSVKQDPDELLTIKRPAWNGEHSGHAYDLLQEEILPKTTGTATILFVWEGGDSQTALHVKDGKVTKKKVKVAVEE